MKNHSIKEFNCSVIALDLKGFGDSDKPSSRSAYKLEILLDELTIFLSSLGISRCAIIGHDIGALLGFYLAHTNADLVSKFVAISCIHPNIYWTERPKSSTFNQTWVLQFFQRSISLKLNNSEIVASFQTMVATKASFSKFCANFWILYCVSNLRGCMGPKLHIIS